MKSKKVDVGFLPPTAYTLAHDQKQQIYCYKLNVMALTKMGLTQTN